MDNSTFIVEGGHELRGEIIPQGAKNEALEVISAVLLTKEEVIISNVPEILDVKNLISLLESMGVKVNRLGHGEYGFKADDIDTEYIESEDFVKNAHPCAVRFWWSVLSSPGSERHGFPNLAATASEGGVWTRIFRE